MIKIENLTFSYQNDDVLNKISTRFNAGNIYGLLGENGVGKSTLLKLIAGLIFPKSGIVSVDQQIPAQRKPNFLSDIFFLPESIVAPNMTGLNYISVKTPFYPQFDNQHFKHCIERLSIPLNQKLSSLSSGQQKKFFLSFGLSCNTRILMLDEPTNGLDIPSKGLFRQLIAESVKDQQTVIIATHQAHDIEALIDALVILKNGSIIFNKTLEETSKTLRMSVSPTKPEPQEDLIYSEAQLGGYASLWNDSGAPDGRIDLELLFKALNSNNLQVPSSSQEH